MAKAKGVQVRDTVLWVKDSGEADLPPVLCLHSLWLDHSMFDALAEAGTGRFRMICPDFRGQAKSAPPTTDVIDMDMCAADMEALVEKLRLRDVNIVAQSMGGDVSLRMAVKRPDLYRSMVMLASSARGGEKDELDFVNQWLVDSYEAGFVGDNLQVLREVMFGETTRKTNAKQPMLTHWSDMLEATPRSTWPAIRGVIHRDSCADLLPDIPTPTLIFSGEEDIARPPEWAQEVVNGLPNAKLVSLPKIGHSPILEDPNAVIPQILDFLTDPVVN